MKFISFLIACCPLFVCANVNLDQKVSLNFHNSSAAEVLKKISQETNAKFIIDPNLPLKNKLSLDVKNAPLKKVLDAIAIQENAAWMTSKNGTIHLISQQ